LAAQDGAMPLILALLALLPAFAATAQAPPCTAEIEGQAACMAGKLCECRFERGGQLIGRPDRFVWDCGAMRPMCPPDPTVSQGQGYTPPLGVWVQPQIGGRPGPLR
jgi:hypothetical protein